LENVEALAKQGIDANASLFIDVPVFQIAKG
jgi:hypothetical protein